MSRQCPEHGYLDSQCSLCRQSFHDLFIPREELLTEDIVFNILLEINRMIKADQSSFLNLSHIKLLCDYFLLSEMELRLK